MAAALRAAATKMLRPAVLLGEGMRFLAPMSSLGGDVADVGASSSVGNVTLDLSLASPSVVSIYQETGPTFGELVRKARDSFGICQFVVCAAGGGEKLQQLKDQVKSLKEKNEQLEAQNKKLELGTEIEKAKIKARRFLGYLLIKSKHGGGGEEPPKMPRQFACYPRSKY